ncbi:hypothetical protein EJ04DRAFT_183494 [Polyplosphaeria fusca]|uniref:Uncharacterized protein n=1 Tax=Polyplosphaeria fusca TaxID=682080 RepID=A0A9P4V0V9_9PLEO|nr:hypothetical protein EJ04DRAFT_183494 [Polyplosphaeria fusca]
MLSAATRSPRRNDSLDQNRRKAEQSHSSTSSAQTIYTSPRTRRPATRHRHIPSYLPIHLRLHRKPNPRLGSLLGATPPPTSPTRPSLPVPAVPNASHPHTCSFLPRHLRLDSGRSVYEAGLWGPQTLANQSRRERSVQGRGAPIADGNCWGWEELGMGKGAESGFEGMGGRGLACDACSPSRFVATFLQTFWLRPAGRCAKRLLVAPLCEESGVIAIFCCEMAAVPLFREAKSAQGSGRAGARAAMSSL